MTLRSRLLTSRQKLRVMLAWTVAACVFATMIGASTARTLAHAQSPPGDTSADASAPSADAEVANDASGLVDSSTNALSPSASWEAPPQMPDASSQTAPVRSDAELGRARRTSFRGAAGYEYARIGGVPIQGARVRLGLGQQNDSAAHYGALSIFYGSTENHLNTWDVRLGWTLDLLRYGPLRLGFDAELGYVTIRRTALPDRLWSIGVGGGGHASIDLLSFGPRNDHAITAEARFDVYLHLYAWMWGPTLMFGFRY